MNENHNRGGVPDDGNAPDGNAPDGNAPDGNVVAKPAVAKPAVWAKLAAKIRGKHKHHPHHPRQQGGAANGNGNGNKGLFLDRDGVINVDYGYVYRVEDFFFNPAIFPICKRFAEQGYTIVVVTNQSGIARGYFTETDFEHITQHMLQMFERNGVHIPRSNVYHCPTLDDNDPRRKPNAGMILEAAEQLGINPAQSVIIGDSHRDITAGIRAGIGRCVKVGATPYSSSHANHADHADHARPKHYHFATTRELLDAMDTIEP